MITKATVYKTRDNADFDNLLDAEIHELGLDLVAESIKQGVIENCSPRALCYAIAKNYAAFEPIFGQIKLKNMRKRKQKRDAEKS